MSVIIGIDPGVKTGYAVISNKKLITVNSDKIHRVMEVVLKYNRLALLELVVVEDPRLMRNKKYLNFEKGKYQGVGSVKRDAKIWEDFLEDHGIKYRLRHPRNTGVKSPAFKELTGWEQRTDQHGRDATLMIYTFMK